MTFQNRNIIPKICLYLLWSQSGTQGALTGVGLSIGYPTKFDGSPAGLVVISAAPGGPANRAGILSGDVILAIDDTSTETMGIYDAAERLQWVSYPFSHLTYKIWICSLSWALWVSWIKISLSEPRHFFPLCFIFHLYSFLLNYYRGSEGSSVKLTVLSGPEIKHMDLM